MTLIGVLGQVPHGILETLLPGTISLGLFGGKEGKQ